MKLLFSFHLPCHSPIVSCFFVFHNTLLIGWEPVQRKLNTQTVAWQKVVRARPIGVLLLFCDFLHEFTGCTHSKVKWKGLNKNIHFPTYRRLPLLVLSTCKVCWNQWRENVTSFKTAWHMLQCVFPKGLVSIHFSIWDPCAGGWLDLNRMSHSIFYCFSSTS